MNTMLADFVSLFFKCTMLGAAVLKETVQRYLEFVLRTVKLALWLLLILVSMFVVSMVLGVQSSRLYQVLLGLVFFLLVAVYIVTLPLQVVVEQAIKSLPTWLRDVLLTQLRRLGIIVFYGLLVVVIINTFQLWQSPSQVFTLFLGSSILWIGERLSWLKVSGALQKIMYLKRQLILILIATIAMAPGPVDLAKELVDWGWGQLSSRVHGLTRLPPKQYYPSSADEIRFADERTGEFLLWYSQDEQGDYELFQADGYDQFGTPYELADTEEEFITIRDWQRTLDHQRELERRAKEEELARQQKEEKIAAAKREAELARQQQYHPSSADAIRFADERTGEFLLWYYQDEPGSYKLFLAEGYDPFGTPYELADTEEEFIAIRDWQRTLDYQRELERRAKEEELAQQQEMERIAAAEREAELARQLEEEVATKRKADAEAAARREAEEAAKRLARQRYIENLIAQSNGRLVDVDTFKNTSSIRISASNLTSTVRNILRSRCDAVMIERARVLPDEIVASGGDVLITSATLVHASFRTPPPRYGDGTRLAVINVTVELRVRSSAREKEVWFKEYELRETYFASEMKGQSEATLVERAANAALKELGNDQSLRAIFERQ